MATSKFPYEEILGDSDPIKVISETQQKLLHLLDDLDDNEIERRAAPHKWNLREIVCHLADCELVWAWCLRYAYGEKGPVLQTFDQDSWAKIYDAYSLSDALGSFASTRMWNLAFISGLKSSDREKAVTHPIRGEETLWTVLLDQKEDSTDVRASPRTERPRTARHSRRTLQGSSRAQRKQSQDCV